MLDDKDRQQKLIVTFTEKADGTQTISVAFDPDMDIAILPEQVAANSVANYIVDHFGLVKGEENESKQIIH